MSRMIQGAIAVVHERAPQARPRVAVVLGSGWGGLTGRLADPVSIAYADLPGFPQATVTGHAGELWLGRLGDVEVAVMSGRRHAYESGDASGMNLPLQVLQALGCSVLVLTNAAGSLDPDMGPGALMLVSDHINLPQLSPLREAGGATRFVGMADAYDPALRERARAVARVGGVTLHEGVYLWCLGPQFETPAEIRAFRMLGADAVGMSTVPETIAARHAGMRVLALSLITNLAAGLADQQLSHAQTLAQAHLSSAAASALLAAIIEAIEPGETHDDSTH